MTRPALLLVLGLAASPAFAQRPSATERATEERVARAQSTFVSALAMQWAGDHSGAIRIFEELLDEDASRAAVHDALAESYVALERYSEALLAAEDAARLAPDDPDVLARLAEEQRRSGALADAARTLEAAALARPGDPSLLSALAERYADLDQHDRAAQALERLIRIGDTPAARLRLAAYARDAGDLDLALGHLRRAAQLAPDEAAITVTLAETLHEAGRAGEAAGVLDAFLRRRPGDVDALAARARVSGTDLPAAARPAEDRLARARDLYDASAEDPALLSEADALIASLLAEGRQPLALALGARIAFDAQDYPAAAERALQAVEEDPRDAALWTIAIRGLSRAGDDRAGRTAEDAMLFFASEPEIRAAAAEALLAMGQPDAALDAAPNTPDGHALRAMALAALGRVDAAASALDDASGADPLLFGTAEGDVAAAGGNDAAAREVWGRTLSAFPGVAWLAARLD